MSKQLKSALLNSSAKTDVVRSGGKVSITGLKSFNVNDLLAVDHRIQKDEVLQVTTIGGTNDPTIAASTKYTIKMGYVHLKGNEQQEISLIPFSHTTPATLSGNAATDRQNVYDALASKINNSDYPATANAGAGGTSMTITDDAPYFDERPGTPRGPSTVLLVDDLNVGGGFDDDLHRETTTDAVFQFGTGDRLIANEPVFNQGVDSNLASGEINAPEGAVSGQDYDAWFISYTNLVKHNAIPGLNAIGVTEQSIFVDNGKGTSTANAAGYAAFRVEMERLSLGVTYGEQDPNAMVSFFDGPYTHGSKIVAGTGLPNPGGAATGADGDENTLNLGDGTVLSQHIIGLSSAISPLWTTAGLEINLDETANEGAEYSAPIETASPKEFVVGTDEFSFAVELTIEDVSGTDDCAVGFRVKAAYDSAIDNYTDFAVLNVISGDITIETNLNGGGTTSTDTTDDWADGETKTLEVRVALDGSVTYRVDDLEPTTVAAFTFDAGDVLIPFVYFIHDTALSDVTLSKWQAVGAILRK